MLQGKSYKWHQQRTCLIGLSNAIASATAIHPNQHQNLLQAIPKCLTELVFKLIRRKASRLPTWRFDVAQSKQLADGGQQKFRQYIWESCKDRWIF